MANQTVTMGLDISNLKSEADKLLQSLNGQGQAFGNLAVQMVDANAAGTRIQATFLAVADSGEKLNIVVRETPAGIRVLSRSFSDADAAAKATGASFGDFANKVVSGFQRAEGVVARQVLRRAVSDLIGDFQAGVQEAQKFSAAVADLQGIQKGPSDATAQWSTQLQTLANQFGVSGTDVAKAAYIALQSGLEKGADDTTLLTTSLKFAKVANIDAADSTKLLATTLNAFKLPASDAEKVAGIYFKTIQNGVVAPQELASQFGRLASTAAGTGVKLEEIAAAVDVLTSRGLKFADATNLVNNLLLAAVKPSKDLKQLFIDIGAGSTEAVIKGQGFGAFLQILDKETRNGNERLGELLPTLRNARAELNLSGDAFEEFNSKLKDISTGGVAALNNAFSTKVGSVGQQITDQYEKVKNYFAQDFGPAVLTVMSTIGQAAEYIHKTVSGLVGGVAGLQQEAQKHDAEIEEKRKGLIDRGNFSQADDQQKSVEDLKKATDDKYKILLDYAGKAIAINDKLRVQSVKNLDQAREATKIGAKEYTDYLGKQLSDIRHQATEAQQIIKESLKISENLQKQGADTIYQQKFKYASPGGFDSGGQRLVDQQGPLIDQSIRQTQGKIREELDKGTKEGLEEARKYYDELQKLYVQQFEHRTGIQKQQFEQDVKTNQVAPSGFGPDGKARYDFVVNTKDIEQKINQLTKERLDVEQQIRDVQLKRQKAAQDAAVDEEGRVKKLQDLLTKAGSFSIFDEQGQTKKKYEKDPKSAAEDFQKIINDIKKDTRPGDLGAGVFRDLGRQLIEVTQQTAIQVNAKQLQLNQEALLQQKGAADKSLEQLGASIKEGRDKIDKNLSDINKNSIPFFEQAAKSNSGPLGIYSTDKNIKASEGARDQLSQLVQGYKALSDQLRVTENPTAEQIKQFQDLSKQLADTAEQAIKLRTGVDDLSKVFIGGKSAQELVDQFRNKSGSALDTKGKNDNINKFAQAQQDFLKVSDAAAALPKAFEAITLSSNNLGDKISAQMDIAGKGVDQLSTKLAETVKNLEKLKADIDALSKFSPSTPPGPYTPNPNNPGPSVPQGSPNPDGLFFGGSPKYFAEGGPVNWQPRGSDRIPAMLGGDEYVMTGQATQQFKPILEAMNARGAAGSSGGSIHNTSIGDIHVNVTGSTVPEQNARKMAIALRRELRRGTVTLQ